MESYFDCISAKHSCNDNTTNWNVCYKKCASLSCTLLIYVILNFYWYLLSYNKQLLNWLSKHACMDDWVWDYSNNIYDMSSYYRPVLTGSSNISMSL